MKKTLDQQIKDANKALRILYDKKNKIEATKTAKKHKDMVGKFYKWEDNKGEIRSHVLKLDDSGDPRAFSFRMYEGYLVLERNHRIGHFGDYGYEITEDSFIKELNNNLSEIGAKSYA